MGRIKNTQEVEVSKLKPYKNNAKIHGDDQLEKLSESIKKFGFLNPCIIDKDHNILAGHGRVLAAQRLGLEKVPCVYVEGLTDEERRAYILADNKLAELATWDMQLVTGELLELDALNFEVDVTGFELPEMDYEQELEKFKEKMAAGELSEDDEDYRAFLEKFEAKRTTDDCYTPDNVYNVVADYVAEHYGKDKNKFIRPFYPGGDYEHEIYPAGAVVVDNPPFSILNDIIKFYTERKINYFLFGPSLTIMGYIQASRIFVKANLMYENGAVVQTGFLTNMDEYAFRTAPDLSKKINEANDANIKSIHAQLPKYEYPPEVITGAQMTVFANHGIEFKVKPEQCHFIRELESQKEHDKAIYGSGYLLSNTATAARKKADAQKEESQKKEREKEPAHIWELSENERQIINGLK